MAYVVNGPLGANVAAAASTTQAFAKGMRAQLDDGSQWIYLAIPTSTTIPQYGACVISPTNQAQGVTNTLAARGMATVIAQLAVTSDSSNVQYMWFLISNPCASTSYKVRAAASCAIDARLGSTAYAGTIDDTTAGSAIPIHGIVLTDSQPSGSSGSRTFRTAINGMNFYQAV